MGRKNVNRQQPIRNMDPAVGAMLGQANQQQMMKQQMTMEHHQYVDRYLQKIAGELFIQRMDAYIKSFGSDGAPALDDIEVIAKDCELAATILGLTLKMIHRVEEETTEGTPEEQAEDAGGIIIEE